ncbi:hypothetical protein BHE74_00057043 [Ensete ventricosum]|uniref:Uncharacterized protein n=1 Tax=Ensete ventricosum TaxID=4639 RepID=A0A444BVH3_ENSVE|nr:hypothetical protein B296_00030812 [Ensete ventricosum]RWV77591.1 hypothetical protein GW17_00061555 [Ensete ventricosum]RWW37793.1 hypothetical protein BHE74_00057043 [Ensete ventricosum]
MGRPLPPGCNSGGYSNIPKPTGSPANFSSQGYAEPDSTLQFLHAWIWKKGSFTSLREKTISALVCATSGLFGRE